MYIPSFFHFLCINSSLHFVYYVLPCGQTALNHHKFSFAILLNGKPRQRRHVPITDRERHMSMPITDRSLSRSLLPLIFLSILIFMSFCLIFLSFRISYTCYSCHRGEGTPFSRPTFYIGTVCVCVSVCLTVARFRSLFLSLSQL